MKKLSMPVKWDRVRTLKDGTVDMELRTNLGSRVAAIFHRTDMEAIVYGYNSDSREVFNYFDNIDDAKSWIYKKLGIKEL